MNRYEVFVEGFDPSFEDYSATYHFEAESKREAERMGIAMAEADGIHVEIMTITQVG